MARTVIIGGGPTGLGAALALQQSQADWCLLEQRMRFGGLADSFVDPRGFTWDYGGHVLFSHYDCFDHFMDLALGSEGWNHHHRESWIWMRQEFIPYPFQSNLHCLSPSERWECVMGLLDAQDKIRVNLSPPRHFGEWSERIFGPGISRMFMLPYNQKVWAVPASEMGYQWIAERVAMPDLRSVLKSICLNQDQKSWGPNNAFRFPKTGGTGAIWQALGRQLPPDRVNVGTRVVAIDPEQKCVYSQDGRRWGYDYLISTMPLNELVVYLEGMGLPAGNSSLRFASLNQVGVGIQGPIPEELKTKCWMYFPEANSPYYRITVLSNYAAANTPHPEAEWSLMAEASDDPAYPRSKAAMIRHMLQAMREDRLIPSHAIIRSIAHCSARYAYPIPFCGRDEVVDPLLRALESASIFSRGRFGAWKYEVGNMDHSFMQGWECANRVIAGGGAELEPTLHRPNWVNGRRNP